MFDDALSSFVYYIMYPFTVMETVTPNTFYLLFNGPEWELQMHMHLKLPSAICL